MAIKHEEEPAVEVQLTPLIDCVFLLLIFFLVSSQLKKVEKRLDVKLPDAQVVKTYKATPDVISVGVSAPGKSPMPSALPMRMISGCVAGVTR